jgi:hypothetical protein
MLDRIPLSRLPRALHAHTGAIPPSYGRLYRAVLDCVLPAVQEHGRWYVDPADLPLIAERLSLAPAKCGGQKQA